MEKRTRILVIIGVFVVLCGGVALCGGYLVIRDLQPAPAAHRYPAPGPGCGDVGELAGGVFADNWDNPHHAGVTCAHDHTNLAAGSPAGSRVFTVESSVDSHPVADITGHRNAGFFTEIRTAAQGGGPDTRSGITLAPFPVLAESVDFDYPVFFFNVDRSRHWHVSHHDTLGRFLADVVSGAVPAGRTTDHTVRVRADVRTFDLEFSVDGTVVSTLRIHQFTGYRIGVGVACSTAASSNDACSASLSDYVFDLWH